MTSGGTRGTAASSPAVQTRRPSFGLYLISWPGGNISVFDPNQRYNAVQAGTQEHLRCKYTDLGGDLFASSQQNYSEYFPIFHDINVKIS